MQPRLSELDLNLLVALDALLELRSVTAAAAALGCTQSAMSQRLARLRDMLGDPLLVRQGRDMVLTLRAEELSAPLREALAGLNAAIAPADAFEPASATGVVHLGLRYAAATFLPQIVSRIAGLAPGIDIHTHTLITEPSHVVLGSGEVDIVVEPQLEGGVAAVSRARVHRTASSLYVQRLFDEGWVVAVRRDHPSIGPQLSLSDYVQTPHILVSLRGDAYGVVDAALADLDQIRRIAVVVQDYQVAWRLVGCTDYILTTASGVAHAFRSEYDARLFRVPFPFPGAPICQIWHDRTHRDPMMKWVRTQCHEAGAEISRQREIDEPLLMPDPHP